MKHQYYKPGDCPGKLNVPTSCNICDGGLAVCKGCGAYEGGLTTDCPGIRVTWWAMDEVYAGMLDFRDGMWRRYKVKDTTEKF